MKFFENELSSPVYRISSYYIENLSWGVHFHKSFEICFVAEGGFNVTVGSEVYELKENDAVILFPYQLHSYETQGYSKVYMTSFLPEFVSGFSDKYEGMIPKSNFCGGLAEYVERLDTDNEFMKRGMLYYMLGMFEQTAEFVMTTKRDETQVILKILQYVEKNYMNKCSLKTIAEELSYGYTYLSRMFNQFMDMNYAEYLNKYRINRAVYILCSERQVRIQDVARRCGYESLCSFNRNFKTFTGTTPTELLEGLSE